MFLGFWATTSAVFLFLMTYKSLHPLSGANLAVATGFGMLIPLSVMIGQKTRDLAVSCQSASRGPPATLPATLLSVFAAVSSCMCCLPILPTVLGTVLAGTALATQVIPLTDAVMQWSPVIYGASALLLVWSIHRGSRVMLGLVDLT